MSGFQTKSFPGIPDALVTSSLECLHHKTDYLGLEKTGQRTSLVSRIS